MPDSGGSLHDDGSPLRLLRSIVQVQLLPSLIILVRHVNCETQICTHLHAYLFAADAKSWWINDKRSFSSTHLIQPEMCWWAPSETAIHEMLSCGCKISDNSLTGYNRPFYTVKRNFRHHKQKTVIDIMTLNLCTAAIVSGIEIYLLKKIKSPFFFKQLEYDDKTNPALVLVLFLITGTVILVILLHKIVWLIVLL